MQSLELLLDPVTDAAVRAQWAALTAAGLPSQQDHRGATNAPHVTLALAGQTTEAAELSLGAVTALLPLPVRLGGLLALGQRRLVLARLVVPSSALLDLHARALAAWHELPGVPDQVRPGQWTPHVTLTRGLPPDQLAAAVHAVRHHGIPDVVGEAVTLRRWDPVRRTAWPVVPQQPGG